MKGITQKQLAQNLGVHQTTISSILSGARAEKFTPEMRARVVQAAHQYGYRPSMTARNLRGAKSGMIGVFHFGSHKDVESERLHEAVNVIHKKGYRPLAISMSTRIMWLPDDEISACSIMADARVEGIVLSGYADDFDLKQLGRFQEDGIPIISINTGLKLPGIPLFGADRYQAAYDLTAHLIANGRQKLLCLHRWSSGLTDYASSTAFTAVEGFRSAARDSGILPENAIVNMKPSPVQSGVDSYEAGEKAFQEIWEGGFHPDAVVCFDDSWAIGVYGYCGRNGIRIPDNVAIVGFESQDIGNFLCPRLTSVKVPYQEMATAGLNYLVDVLQGGKPALETTYFGKCSLIIRESCGADKTLISSSIK